MDTNEDIARVTVELAGAATDWTVSATNNCPVRHVPWLLGTAQTGSGSVGLSPSPF